MRVSNVMIRIPEPLSPSSTLLEAADALARSGAQALPVVEDGKPVGLLTERDLVFGAVQEDSDGDEVPAFAGRVDRAMRPVSAVCLQDEELDTVLERAASRGDRHLVVLGAGGEVVGVLSLRESWFGEAADETSWR